MHSIEIDMENTESGQAAAPGKIKVLSKSHNILHISQEAISERLQGRNLIYYLSDWDAIVIAGWEEETALIAELIADYLELTPSKHERALAAPIYTGPPGMILKIWQTLEAIYQVPGQERSHEIDKRQQDPPATSAKGKEYAE